MSDQVALQILAIGIPTVSVFLGVLINNSRISDLRVHFDAQLTGLRSEMQSLRNELKADLLRMEGVMDARLSHLEDRLGR